MDSGKLAVAVHHLAHVDATVKIGQGTKVWQFASVIRGALLGECCTVGGCAIVDGAVVGDFCAIGHGAQLHPGTKLGHRVFVGPGGIACNDMWPSVDPTGFEMPDGSRFTVVVEDDAAIGAGAVILPGVRIGKGALVAAGAVVEEDVPPGTVYRRNGYMSPCVPVGWRQRRMRWC